MVRVRAVGAGRRDVGLRLDVAAARRDPVATTPPRGAVAPAPRRQPGEEAREHPLEHLPAPRHASPSSLILPCVGGSGHRWRSGCFVRVLRQYPEGLARSAGAELGGEGLRARSGR